jgi:hypothetical protein
VPDLGIRLQLLIGATVPIPAPYDVMDALISLQIENKDKDFDVFTIVFSLGRDSITDYGLLQHGYLTPPNRVVITAIINGLPQVLIDGVITYHQVVVSNRPGESTLHVFGKDIGFLLDLEDKNETYPNQSDSTIVTIILARYATYGLVPTITLTTDIPIQTDRIPTQQTTDLKFVRQLATRNGFVFYIEPTAPGANTAYWGPENRLGQPQPALTINIGPNSNMDSPLTSDYDAEAPEKQHMTIMEPISKISIPVPTPTSFFPTLSANPAKPLRITRARDTAKLSMTQALLQMLMSQSNTSEAVKSHGEVDALRYGQILRSRRLVKVLGAGQNYDGSYYVTEVTHKIKKGEYKQSFTLVREGLGATV